MGDERVAAEDLAALRAALLALHEDFLVPLPSRRSQRVLRRMQRAHLSWLLAPWFVVTVFGAFRYARMRGSAAVEARAYRLYGQLSGKDPYVARAEVDRMLAQLGSLDERHRWLDDEERPGAPRGADRAELEAAAGALLGYYLAGRRTDDQLLAQVQAAWAESEGLTHEQMQRGLERGVRGGRPEPEDELRERAAGDRYLLAWRRWLDQQAPHASPGLGGP